MAGTPAPVGTAVGAALAQARAARADLEAELATVADPDVVALDDEHDAEGSTIGYERARIAGLLARTERRIADLDEAAERLARGTYGRCDRCGLPIGAERLAALPTARRCISCAAAPAPTAPRSRPAG